MADDQELIRDVWRRWNAGDRRLDAESFDPEFEVHSYLTGDSYRGEERVRTWMAEIDQQFEGWELGIDEIRFVDDRRALVHGTIRGLGRASGIELDEPAAWIVEVRGGRMLAVHNFIGRDAIEAAEASVS